jgi:hypothetical protein
MTSDNTDGSGARSSPRLPVHRDPHVTSRRRLRVSDLLVEPTVNNVNNCCGRIAIVPVG